MSRELWGRYARAKFVGILSPLEFSHPSPIDVFPFSYVHLAVRLSIYSHRHPPPQTQTTHTNTVQKRNNHTCHVKHQQYSRKHEEFRWSGPVSPLQHWICSDPNSVDSQSHSRSEASWILVLTLCPESTPGSWDTYLHWLSPGVIPKACSSPNWLEPSWSPPVYLVLKKITELQNS